MHHDLLNGLRRITTKQVPALMRAARMAGVYALVDPREPERVRYVGSSQHMAKRLVDHANSLTGKADAERKHWVRNMRESGCSPVMVLLEEVSAGKASFEMHLVERNWIERFRSLGQADLNRTLLSEERDFLLAHIKTLQAENAELRTLVLQRATQREKCTLRCCCEDPESATQRNGGLWTRCSVAEDRAQTGVESAHNCAFDLA